jgi:hypothetical protein
MASFAPLADNVRRPELLGESDAARVAAEEDDPLGTEALARDHAAQTDGTVTDDCRCLAGFDLGRSRGVVSSSHDVREREQGLHRRIVHVSGKDDERPIRMGDTHGLALAAVDVPEAVPAAVEAFAVQTLTAEDAGAVAPLERRNHKLGRP